MVMEKLESMLRSSSDPRDYVAAEGIGSVRRLLGHDISLEKFSERPTSYMPGRSGISGQIVEDLKQKIETGVFQYGEKLESMRTMAKKYDVSPVTFMNAAKMLEQQGYLDIKQGKGTFVSFPNGK